MSKHTPGPWGIEQTDDTNWIGFMSPDARKAELIVCTTDRCSLTNEALERNDANARLIAAAPDLVIELRQAIIQMEMAAECIEKGRHDEALLHVSSLMRSKKEVFAKATGESL